MRYKQENLSADADLGKIAAKYAEDERLVLFIDFSRSGYVAGTPILYYPFIIIIPEGERPDIEVALKGNRYICHEHLDHFEIEYDLPTPGRLFGPETKPAFWDSPIGRALRGESANSN